MAALSRPAALPGVGRWRMERRQPRLRIAVFADGPDQPRWMVEAFARIARSDFADVVLVAARRNARKREPLFWRASRKLDRLFFGQATDPSERVPLRAALPLARHVGCTAAPGEMGAAWRRSGLTDLPLDVVFALGDVDDREIDHISRHGVWRWCYGAHHDHREELAGWREVAKGMPATSSGLRVGRRGYIDRLLCHSRSRTYAFSALRNRSNLLRKTALFAERELRQLHRNGDLQMGARGTPPAPPIDADPLPGAGEVLMGMARVGGRIAQRAVQKLLNVDQWFVAWRFGDPAEDGDFGNYRRLMPPKDRIWADPFPLSREGRHYVFFEEVPFATGRGRIAAIEMTPEGPRGQPVPVLERPYHLSYPFLIEHGDDLFMVPESGANRSVELYRCLRFPDVWRFEKTLLRDMPTADATFHRSGGRWWMFVTSGAEGTELYDELHLYHADDLLGDWHPHPGNPVKSDVWGARPAGRLYERNGVLCRPGQICAPLYGTGISISQVLELTPHSYRETEVARVLPPPGVLGVHTINRSGALAVLDGFVRRNRWMP